MAHFIGVDTAMRKTGICFLAADSISGTEVQLVKVPQNLKGASHLAYYRKCIEDVFYQSTFIYGAIEDGSLGSRGRIFQLGQVNGLAQSAMITRRIPFVCAVPSQLKKFLTGSGRASKEDMIAAASDAMGVQLGEKDDNLADAYGLARIAKAMHTGVCETAAQREVLDALTDKAATRVFTPSPK